MQFTYTGSNPNFLEDSFFDPNGVLSFNVTSISSDEVVVTHTVYTQANVFIVLKGDGFLTDALGLLTAGTITSIEFNGLDIRQATVTDINWDAQAFQTAILDVANSGDVAGLVALFNQSSEITIDASDGLSGFDQELSWGGFIPLITQPLTFIGSRFHDSVVGTSQDDVISSGQNGSDGDRIAGSEGDDRIIFDAPDGSDNTGYYLDYDPILEGMTFEVDGVANTGSASGPGFVDTLENVTDALGDYLGIEGTVADDTYDVRLADGQAFSFIGGSGADRYNLTTTGGQPILDYFFNNITTGIDADLSTGIIANDGFGTEDRLDITGTPDTLFLLATNAADRIVDGAGDQVLITYQGDDLVTGAGRGNDSIDSGSGVDTVAFETLDRGQTTITFDRTLAIVEDRAAPGNSTTMFGVEFVDPAFGATIEIAKHDGIGVISETNLTALTELYVAYFNRAPDAEGLSFWATAFVKNGFSLNEIAELFFTDVEAAALYDGVSDGDFVQAVYNNVFGRDADTAGFNFWTGQLASGNVTESTFIVDLLAGARASTGDPDDVAYVDAKTDIGLYFAVIQGQNNTDDATDVMDTFNGTTESIMDAVSLSDTTLAEAIDSSTELLLPVVGVIDSPFISVA